jgi:general secretion pathway protein D
MKFRVVIMVVLAALACAGEQPGHAKISKHNRREAETDYRKAVALQKEGDLPGALKSAAAAAVLDPNKAKYGELHDSLLREVAAQYVTQGNMLADAGDNAAARTRFQAAQELDPDNTFTRQRLLDVAPEKATGKRHLLEVVAGVDQIEVRPKPGRQSFHLNSDTRAIYDQITRAFGVSVQYDTSLPSRRFRFDTDDADFYTAMALVGKLGKTFWAPLSEHQAVIAPDTLEMRMQYERLAMRVFYVNVTTSAEVNDIAALMRSVFDIRLINVQATQNKITVRAPKDTIEAMAVILDNLIDTRPEVMLDVQAYEMDSERALKAGLTLPTDFQIFSIAAEIFRILGPNAQAVIDQLSKTGTINPALIPPDALAKLQGSPLLAPFIFLGTGNALIGIAFPANLGAQLSRTSSESVNLEHVHLRAEDGEAATFRVGTRVPIVNSIFQGVTLDNQGRPLVGSPVPSVQYEDVGLTLKSTPHYHRDDLVTLNMELSIHTLGAVQSNGIPLIITREYKGTITLKDGEPAVVTGEIEDSDTRSSSGNPGLGQIPLVQGITNLNAKDRIHQEILIVVTPRIIRKAFHDSGATMVPSSVR